MKTIHIAFTIRPYLWVRNTIAGAACAVAVMTPQRTSNAHHVAQITSPLSQYRDLNIGIVKDELNDSTTDMSHVEINTVSTTIVEESIAARYDPLFVVAIMETESNFSVEAVSRTGARGLMQIIPSTFRTVSDARRMFDPVENVRAGIRYLSKLNSFKRIESVLLAYNQGPGTAIDVSRGGDIPSEAQVYIARVVSKYKVILERYNRNPKLAHKSFRVSPDQYAIIFQTSGGEQRSRSIISNHSEMAYNP